MEKAMQALKDDNEIFVRCSEIRAYTLSFIKNTKGYYRDYFFRLLAADEETRNASIEHWEKCHIENMNAGREDLILFSAKQLGAGLLAKKLLAHKEGEKKTCQSAHLFQN